MISYFIFLQHSQGRAIALRLNHREWGGYFEMVSVFVLPGPKAVSGSQCGGKKPGSFLFFFLFCKMHFLPNVKNWTSMWKPRESHIWPSACHHVCSPAVILGLLLENLCLLFSFVSHFIQHWHLSAASCTHQWSSWLIYKMLAFFSQSIYSYKVAGVIAVSSDVYSAGFCKMKSKLTSALITVWITRLMQCNMPRISFNESKRCLAWVSTEWNISTSGFDPVALDDQ